MVKMVENNLFPQGLATGEAFLNREKERERLRTSFLNNEHTVIVAPRRYGKSSLIRQVLLDTKISGKRIDLLPATNAAFVNRAIKTCVSDLINEIAPKTKQARQKLMNFIMELHPKLSFNLFGQGLEITAVRSSESNIVDLLIGLDAAAKQVNKKVAICLDEFQQIGLLKNSHSIEASIRHAVESSQFVTYIFSGSNRHLLSQMFNTKSRPLYHLCDLMRLERISQQTYVDILYDRATQKWSVNIDRATINEITSLTKCHPYYVNALCRQIWKKLEPPSVASVQRDWFSYIDTQNHWISDDLGRLSPNQRNILAALAYEPIAEPYSQEFSEKVKIGPSSIKTSLGILMRNDFVSKGKKGKYEVLDPAIETYLQKINYFDFLDN